MPNKTNLTIHAAQRIAQRGVSNEALELLVLFGSDIPAGKGVVKRRVLDQSYIDLIDSGYSIELADQAMRLCAVIASDETIITCYKRDPRPYKRRRKAVALGSANKRYCRRHNHVR